MSQKLSFYRIINCRDKRFWYHNLVGTVVCGTIDEYEDDELRVSVKDDFNKEALGKDFIESWRFSSGYVRVGDFVEVGTKYDTVPYTIEELSEQLNDEVLRKVK